MDLIGRSLKNWQVFLLTISLLFSSCAQSEEETPEVPEDVDIRPEVLFSIADNQPLHIYIESQGVVEAGREAVIRPRISGFIESSKLEDGVFVEKDEVILRFIDDEWKYQYEQALNEYESAMSAYEIERLQREQSGKNSDDDQMVRISTGLAKAELDLERAKLDLSYTTMEAPFSGYLSVKDRLSPGTYVNANNEAGRLIDNSFVLIRLDVLEAELTELQPGMAVELTTPSGMRKKGEIKTLSPVVNAESKTGQVLVEVENTERELRPGMTVEGRILVRSHSGKTRVPRSAILERDGGRTLVFKLNGEQVEWIYTEPDFQNSDWAIINHESIEPGDTLAVDRHFAISHLQYVRPRLDRGLIREESTDLD